MRFWLSGPRIGWFRPGVSFSAQDLRPQVGKSRHAREKLDGSFVYVIRGDHNLCKIGVSKNPTARLATLRNGSPFPISFAFIGATDGTNGFAIEGEAHRVLNQYRAQGEWFDISPEMAIATVWAAAASLGERLAGVDPDRVDEVIRLCTSGEKRPRESIIVSLLTWIITLLLVGIGYIVGAAIIFAGVYFLIALSRAP